MATNDYTPVDFQHVSDVTLTTRPNSNSSSPDARPNPRQNLINAYPDKFDAFADTYDALINTIRTGSADGAQAALEIFDSELRNDPAAARRLDDDTIVAAGKGTPEAHLDRIKQCIERIFEVILSTRSTYGTDPLCLAWFLHIPTAEEDIPDFRPNKAQAFLRDLDATHADNHPGKHGNELEQAVRNQLSQLNFTIGNRWFSFATTDPTDSGSRELDINTRFNGEDTILEVFTGSDHLKARQVRDYTHLYAMALDDRSRPHAVHVSDTKPSTIPVEMLQLLLSERCPQQPTQISHQEPNRQHTATLTAVDTTTTSEPAEIVDLLNDADIYPGWASLDTNPDEEITTPYPITRVEFTDTLVYLGFHNDTDEESVPEHRSPIRLEDDGIFYWVTVTRPDYDRGHTITTLQPNVLLALLYLGTSYAPVRLGTIQHNQRAFIGRTMAYKTTNGALAEGEVLDVYSGTNTELWVEFNLNGLGTRVNVAGDTIQQCLSRTNNSWADSGQYIQLYLRNPHTDSDTAGIEH